jgi:regulator of sigma E protease
MIVLAVVIGLSLTILVHEAGHFLAAKLSGIRVLEFGFGFPPRLLGAVRQRERVVECESVEESVQETTVDTAQGEVVEIVHEVHEVDEVVPTTRWVFSWGKPQVAAAERMWRDGLTVYSVNWLPFGGFVRLYGEDGAPEKNAQGESVKRGRAFSLATFPRKAFTMLAGVTMNIVFGWLLFTVVFMAGTPEHLMIADAAPESPAAVAGLAAGDVIVRAEVNGEVLTDPIAIDAFVSLTKATVGKPMALSVQRGSDVYSVTLTGRENPPAGEGALGVGLNEIGTARLPFFSALWEGVLTTGRMLGAVVAGFYGIVTGLFVRPEVLQSVSGPVGIVDAAVQTGSLGIIYIFQFMALVSLNLAVLNLVPFPALDGGRFLMLAFERIFHREFPRRFQTVVNSVGFAALILLMIFVTVQDVGRL